MSMKVAKSPAKAFVREATKGILEQVAKLTDSEIDNASIDGEGIANSDKEAIRKLREVARTDWEAQLPFNALAITGVNAADVAVTSDAAGRTLDEILAKAETIAPELAILRADIAKNGLFGVLLREQAAMRNSFIGVAIPQDLAKVLTASGLVVKTEGAKKPAGSKPTAAEVSDF